MRIAPCIILLTLMTLLPMSSSHAESPPDTVSQAWKTEFELALGATQARSSENWEGGEYGFFAWISDLRARAEKPITHVWDLTGELKVSFGQEHRHVEETETWSVPKRTADRLRGDLIALYTRGWEVDPYAAVSGESQFSDESVRKRRHFNPIDLTESAGVARYLLNRPRDVVILTRVGLGLRQHFHIVDDLIDPCLTTYESQKDGGVEWVTDTELGSVLGRYSFVSKLTFFQAIYSSLPAHHRDWEMIDISWDNTLRLYATRFLQTSLNWQFLYDKQISARGRFMEMLSLSLAYRFSR